MLTPHNYPQDPMAEVAALLARLLLSRCPGLDLEIGIDKYIDNIDLEVVRRYKTCS